MYWVNTGYLDEPHWEYSAEEVIDARANKRTKAEKAKDLLAAIAETIGHIKATIDECGVEAISDIDWYMDELYNEYLEYDETRDDYEEARDRYENMADNLYYA